MIEFVIDTKVVKSFNAARVILKSFSIEFTSLLIVTTIIHHIALVHQRYRQTQTTTKL